MKLILNAGQKLKIVEGIKKIPHLRFSSSLLKFQPFWEKSPLMDRTCISKGSSKTLQMVLDDSSICDQYHEARTRCSLSLMIRTIISISIRKQFLKGPDVLLHTYSIQKGSVFNSTYNKHMTSPSFLQLGSCASNSSSFVFLFCVIHVLFPFSCVCPIVRFLSLTVPLSVAKTQD